MMQNLQQHPLSAAFPSMPTQELEALAIDIEKHGQREPGVLYDGMVLDGWHRYLACEKAGTKFLCGEFTGDDPVSFVIGKNLHRRHLTASQRASAVVAATNWRRQGETTKAAPGAGLTEKQMAQSAEVSERTIRQAKAAQEAGLGDEVREGTVSAKAAAEVAQLPPASRAKAVQDIKDGKPAPKPKVVAADPKFEKLYGEVKAELAEAKEALAELADTAASVESFKNDTAFQDMQVLRVELRSVKQRRDELMRENAQLKTEVKRWRKKAEGK